MHRFLANRSTILQNVSNIANITKPRILSSLSSAKCSCLRLNETNHNLVLSKSVSDYTEALWKHNHIKTFTAERAVTVGMMGLFPLAFAFPGNAFIDNAIAVGLGAHIYWGLEGVIVDYLRPRVVGAVPALIAFYGIRVLGALMFAAMFLFNYNDVGLTTAVTMFWKL